MQKIGLLIDSTTLTRNDILTHPCIKVAPLNVLIDGIEYRETDITEAQMMGHLHTAKKMTTSQPAPGEFLRLYEEYQREGYTHVLVVLISDKISGTAQSAVIAKGMLDVPLEVEIYPTAVASYGVTNGVMALIADIEAGHPFDQVVGRAALATRETDRRLGPLANAVPGNGKRRTVRDVLAVGLAFGNITNRHRQAARRVQLFGGAVRKARSVEGAQKQRLKVTRGPGQHPRRNLFGTNFKQKIAAVHRHSTRPLFRKPCVSIHTVAQPFAMARTRPM